MWLVRRLKPIPRAILWAHIFASYPVFLVSTLLLATLYPNRLLYALWLASGFAAPVTVPIAALIIIVSGNGGRALWQLSTAASIYCVIFLVLFLLISTHLRTWSDDDSLRQCRRCGYDLTANATGVCPECGGPVPGKVKA